MTRILLALLLLVVLTLGAALSYFNWDPVPFNYLAGETQVPLVALLIGMFAGGVLAALLLCAGRILALRAEILRLRRQLNGANSELKNLRNLPLKDV